MVAVPLEITKTLTGLARTRTGWRGRQILQVQVRLQRKRRDFPNRPGLEPKWIVGELVGDPWHAWEDATADTMDQFPARFRIAEDEKLRNTAP